MTAVLHAVPAPEARPVTAEHALLVWLLELIRRAPEPVATTPSTGLRSAETEAIELTWRGQTFRIRVDEVLA